MRSRFRELGLLLLLACACSPSSAPTLDGAPPDEARRTGKSPIRIEASGTSEGGGSLPIAVVAPMSGQWAAMGVGLQRGVALCVEDWNRGGGVLGRDVELMVEDDRDDPEVARMVAARVAERGVVGVVGHLGSAPTRAALPSYRDRDLVVVIPAASDPDLTTEEGLVFRLCAPDDAVARRAAESLQRFGPDRVAVLHDGGDYGLRLAERFHRFVSELYEGALSEPEELTDAQAVVRSWRRSSPDLVFFAGGYAAGGDLVRAVQAMRVPPTILLGDGLGDVRLLPSKAGDGGVVVVAPAGPTGSDLARVRSRLEDRYGTADDFGVLGYSACQVLLEGVQMAGGTEGRSVATSIRGSSHATPWGDLGFDGRGELVDPGLRLVRLQEGQLVPVEEK